MAVLAVVLIFVFTSIDPPKVLFAGFLTYGLSGPVLYLLRRRQRVRRRVLELPEPKGRAKDGQDSPQNHS